MDTALLGKSIRSNRDRLRLTQEQLAELLGVSSHYIYELERGLKLPSLPMLVTMAEVFHCGIDALLSNETEEGGEDGLSVLIGGLSTEKRARLCEVLRGLLPHLKL